MIFENEELGMDFMIIGSSTKNNKKPAVKEK